MQVIAKNIILVRHRLPKNAIDFAGELIDVLRVNVSFAAACQEDIDKSKDEKILFHCQPISGQDNFSLFTLRLLFKKQPEKQIFSSLT
jgi:hypothetical protein